MLVVGSHSSIIIIQCTHNCAVIGRGHIIYIGTEGNIDKWVCMPTVQSKHVHDRNCLKAKVKSEHSYN